MRLSNGDGRGWSGFVRDTEGGVIRGALLGARPAWSLMGCGSMPSRHASSSGLPLYLRLPRPPRRRARAGRALVRRGARRARGPLSPTATSTRRTTRPCGSTAARASSDLHGASWVSVLGFERAAPQRARTTWAAWSSSAWPSIASRRAPFTASATRRALRARGRLDRRPWSARSARSEPRPSPTPPARAQVRRRRAGHRRASAPTTRASTRSMLALQSERAAPGDAPSRDAPLGRRGARDHARDHRRHELLRRDRRQPGARAASHLAPRSAALRRRRADARAGPARTARRAGARRRRGPSRPSSPGSAPASRSAGAVAGLAREGRSASSARAEAEATLDVLTGGWFSSRRRPVSGPDSTPDGPPRVLDPRGPRRYLRSLPDAQRNSRQACRPPKAPYGAKGASLTCRS